MRYEDVEVRSHGTVVEIIRVPIYESLQEIIESTNVEDALAKYNRQAKTDMMNEARTEAATKSLGQKPRRAQIGPEIEAEINEILEKYGSTNRGYFTLFMQRILLKVRGFFKR